MTAAEVDALIGRAAAAAPTLAGGGASAAGAAPWWVPLVIVCVQGVVGPPAKAWARAWDGVGEAAEERARKRVLARRRKAKRLVSLARPSTVGWQDTARRHRRRGLGFDGCWFITAPPS